MNIFAEGAYTVMVLVLIFTILSIQSRVQKSRENSSLERGPQRPRGIFKALPMEYYAHLFY